MDIFKQASFEKLRVQTSRGPLSPEQLWDLSVTELDTLAVSLQEEHAQSGKKSFIKKSSPKDKTTKLKFDVVLEILNTKMDIQNAAQEAAEVREHNKKILGIIADKKDESLKGKTVKQLEEMLK